MSTNDEFTYEIYKLEQEYLDYISERDKLMMEVTEKRMKERVLTEFEKKFREHL